MSEVAVTQVFVNDLKDIHLTLSSVLSLLQAEDIANAARNMQDVRYRPLTNEVSARVERVQGILGDHLLAAYLEGSDEVEATETPFGTHITTREERIPVGESEMVFDVREEYIPGDKDADSE